MYTNGDFCYNLQRRDLFLLLLFLSVTAVCPRRPAPAGPPGHRRGDQQVRVGRRDLPQPGQETEAGAEQDNQATGQAREPHVGQLVDREVVPPDGRNKRELKKLKNKSGLFSCPAICHIVILSFCLSVTLSVCLAHCISSCLSD